MLLGTPKIAPALTLTVPAADGEVATEFGVKVGLADINWYDAEIEAYITDIWLRDRETYADTVDYFKYGVVDRAFIDKEKRAPHK